MPNAPQHRSTGDSSPELAPAGGVSLAVPTPLGTIDTTTNGISGLETSPSHESFAYGNGTASDGYYEEDEEEEVMGGGCVVPSNSSAGIKQTEPAASHASDGSWNVLGGIGAEQSSDEKAEAAQSNGFVMTTSAQVTHNLAKTAETISTAVEEEKAKEGISGATKGLDYFKPNTPLSSLIPPSLQQNSLFSSSSAVAYSSLIPQQPIPQHDSAFSMLYPDSIGGAAAFDDNWPVSSPEDYAAVAREAHGHWRSRSKQPTGITEQASADIRDFMIGSARRRLRLVLIQLHDLLDKAPRVYELLERKCILDASSVTQSRIDRALNSLWGELKARCSLLILDKETSHSIVRQSPLADHDDFTDKVESVQLLVRSALEGIVENCTLLWELFDTSVRGLVLISSGASIIGHMWNSAKNESLEIQRSLVSVLLESYTMQPDLYKVAIKDVVEGILSSADWSGIRVVRAGLRRHRVLPGVLFRSMARSIGTEAQIDEARLFLDGMFRAGASSWVGQSSSGARPKYSQAGTEIKNVLIERFDVLAHSSKQQHVLSYVRAVSGLIGYLRLDVSDADFVFFRKAAEVSLSRNLADACAALFFVLVGFTAGPLVQQILDAVYGVSKFPSALQIDCLMAHLATDQVKDVDSFISLALGMDFTYPRERLYYLKDIATSETASHFSGPSLCRRLVAKETTSMFSGSGNTLQRSAVLHCLQSGMFQNCGVDVREWMTDLIRVVNAATADQCGHLVKAYASAIFGSVSITPIPETLLWNEFSAQKIDDPSGRCAPPSQVLFLLYVLYYCENLLEQPKRLSSAFVSVGRRPTISSQTLANGTQGSSGAFGAASNGSAGIVSGAGRSSPLSNYAGAVKRGEYSDQLLDSLPVLWIFLCVSTDQRYQLLWPELLAMATAQHPDQLDTVSVLQRELAGGILDKQTGYASQAMSHGFIDHMRLVKTAQKLCERITLLSETESAMGVHDLRCIIEEYSRLPVPVRMETCGLLAERLCLAAIKSVSDDQFTASVRQTWLSLHALSPHAVSAAVVNAWRSASEATKPRLTVQDIWLDPLVIFRSDYRIFQSASLVDILLTVLGEFLVLSRSTMRRIFTLRQKENGALKRSHLTAIIQLQESSALQMLIETVQYIANEDARWLVYEFIHARFLEQRTIQKLVHFQAYSIDSILGMVSCVPSMHACSEFIPELLMQSAPRLQLFAVKLASAITTKYPIPANEGMAKEVILPHIQTTLVQIAGTSTAEKLSISNAMLSAVVDIDSVFPLIHNECKRLAAAVKDSAVDKARGVLQAQASQTQQAQQLIVAQWIGCCEHVLAIMGTSDSSSGRLAFVRIEDTEIEDPTAKLEHAAAQTDKKTGNPGRTGSPAPQEAANQSLSANGPPAPPGASRSAAPPLPHLHQGHHSQQPPSQLQQPQQQQQQQHGQPQGPQKRPYGAMSSDRANVRTSSQRELGTQPAEFGRGRSQVANGAGTSHYGLQMVPESMTSHGSGVMGSPHLSGGHQGGPGTMSPSGSSVMVMQGGFKKRGGRHRSRGPPGKEGGPGAGAGASIGAGPGGHSKRGKNPGSERPRIKDHIN
ncbi:hypothetical protein H4R99_003870 [Coemansia sp. RSA 1722]|nr:hypothetical protein IWW45_002159 [Coemansia sp. RSA 485]KAJ2599023.1 hypothetical protein H4R99_003870 [Coemansia sp. RSA 1722]KAJ2599654.1 hypothetical protein GGF39_002140 [Coemansia sp. RSA 1721]